MKIEDIWPATEVALLREANSLGGLLQRLRGCISPTLIDGRGWESVVDRARELPPTVTAFPFGFELPLHDSRPEADFGVSLVGGSRSAELFQETVRSQDTEPSVRRITWLLDEIGREDSALRRVVGRKLLLEYDTGPSQRGTPPGPGIFLYAEKGILVGDGGEGRLRDLGVAADAVVSAAGWDSDPAERKQIERIYLGATPETRVHAIGAFPARTRGVRVATTGFRKTPEVLEFLHRAGWIGQHSTAASVISRLEERNAFSYMGVHFDVRADGVGPKLGLSFFAREAEWLKDIRHWAPLIDGIREQRLARPEKLSALVDSSSGTSALFCTSGLFLLLRGIHHFKLVLAGDRVEQVKAYVFLWMMCDPSQGSSSAS